MANNQQANSQNIMLMTSLTKNVGIKERMLSMLGENSATFLASVLDIYKSDKYLMACDPNAVMQEAMKAAALKLPISKSLGFAYIVAYKNVPTFIMGYRGYIQLAMRTGQYKTINADCVYEGEQVVNNRITGEVSITGEATSEKAIGYFAHFEMLNGFTKTLYWTREKVDAHAKKFSPAYTFAGSPWQTNFDAMACKTMLRQLIGKYGFMSVEYMDAIAKDQDEIVEAEVRDNGNKEPISIDNGALEAEGHVVNEKVDAETGEILHDDSAQQDEVAELEASGFAPDAGF